MNENLRKIAKEIIRDNSVCQSFRKKVADIFFPSNVAIIKWPVAEFELIDDKMDTCMVLSCWKLGAILDKIHQDIPPTPGYHWKYMSSMVHPHRTEYNYIYFNMMEGDYERKESAVVTKL